MGEATCLTNYLSMPCLLGTLRSVGLHLVISDNGSLSSLHGLGSLMSVGEDLFLRRNARLEGLQDWGTSIEAVGGSLYVEGNKKLSGLGQLPMRLHG